MKIYANGIPTTRRRLGTKVNGVKGTYRLKRMRGPIAGRLR